MDAALEAYLRKQRGLPVEVTEEDAYGADPADMDRSLSPEPLALRERPRFNDMLGSDTLQNIRSLSQWETRGEDMAADELAEAGGQQLLAMKPSALTAPPEARGVTVAAGGRMPLPAGRGMPVDEGSGGSTGYLDALRRAQRMDDLSAAVGRSNAAMQQLAGVTSRGVFQPQALPPMPSEVSKELQRRAAVAEYLKQKREEESSAADIRLKNAHAKFYETPKPTPPAKPLPTPKELAESRDLEKRLKESQIAANNRRGLPRPPKAEKKERNWAEEKQAEYERRLKEGIPAGWELQPGAQPTQKQREEAAKIVISRGMVDDSIKQVRELLKTPGAVANPRVRDLLAQQGQFIQTQLRVLEDLGVPSGPDAKILETLIGSPSSIVGEALDTTQQKLDALGKYVGKRVDTTASTYGLRRKQAAAAAAANGGPVHVRRKSDGAVVEVPAQTADKLVKAKLADLVP